MRTTGKVKWFNDNKGYGFIQPDDGSRDVFVHRTAIDGSGGGRKRLLDGQSVEYDLVAGRKGPEAQNVTAVES
jgi:CspA family cold shock protein